MFQLGPLVAPTFNKRDTELFVQNTRSKYTSDMMATKSKVRFSVGK